MTGDLIAKGNKIIAEFMQVAKCDRCEDCGHFKFGPGVFFEPYEMKYHSSWDWLMPALKKFDSFFKKDFKAEYCWGEYVWFCELIDAKVTLYDIEMIYPHFIQALKWYNENKK